MSKTYDTDLMPKVLRVEFLRQKDIMVDDEITSCEIPKPDDIALEDSLDRIMYDWHGNYKRNVQVLRWLVMVEILVEITENEMENIQVTRGKKYDYKIDGKFYRYA